MILKTLESAILPSVRPKPRSDAELILWVFDNRRLKSVTDLANFCSVRRDYVISVLNKYRPGYVFKRSANEPLDGSMAKIIIDYYDAGHTVTECSKKFAPLSIGVISSILYCRRVGSRVQWGFKTLKLRNVQHILDAFDADMATGHGKMDRAVIASKTNNVMLDAVLMQFRRSKFVEYMERRKHRNKKYRRSV